MVNLFRIFRLEMNTTFIISKTEGNAVQRRVSARTSVEGRRRGRWSERPTVNL